MDHISLAEQLGDEVDAFYSKYRDLDDESASRRPGEDSWSPKEIIGHLIDSASNNHQRFVRLQIQEKLVFPGYGKDNMRWVTIEHYNDMRYGDVLSLWRAYNVLIGNIIRNADPAKLQNYWDGDEGKKTLLDLMTSYVDHLKGHLATFSITLEKMGN
ncbi:MAG: DinB family protein [Dehalococcoidia bacterium]